jgi:hypothetical protein
LNRYEVPNRSGSGLFLILMRSSYLNFKKSLYCQYIRFESADPGIVPEGFYSTIVQEKNEDPALLDFLYENTSILRCAEGFMLVTLVYYLTTEIKNSYTETPKSINIRNATILSSFTPYCDCFSLKTDWAYSELQHLLNFMRLRRP